MNTETEQQAPPPAPQRKNTALKLGIGCGIACLILLAAAGTATFIGIKFAMKYLNEMTAEFETKGFSHTVRGQSLVIKKPITEPSIYVGQLVQIKADCSTNIAIIAQVAEIHGNIKGKLYFKGQVLKIMPTATIENGAEVTAQSFVNEGTIKGTLTEKTQSSTMPVND